MIRPYNAIVVVDDNPTILTALKICLTAEFERIVTLTSPDALVSTLSNEEHVDVVLLDMNFSLGVNTGQDGLFWLRTLKKLHPDTPVVLMTAYADVQLAVKGLKNGAADFVTKPWDNDELVRTLRDAVEKSREVVTLDKLEQQHVHRVVEQCHGNMSKAAELLGITRQTLYRKLKL
ncbi:response regulator [Leyella stercorea]|uniref:response regulator n=1 Tax=Leyella stercorea TaxID=363265 RepID=UPI0026731051|nr:response regulator [Leyella stercorea]